MTNVVSYSWFRHGASGYETPNAGTSQGIFFLNFLRCLVRAHHAVWAGWELRIHHDDRVTAFPYFRALQKMHAEGLLKLVDCGKAETLCGSMLWRMKPLWEPGVGWVVMRDVDSLAMPRDRVMVEEAIDSPAIVHAVLDSESHSGPLMGGMTASKVAPDGFRLWETFLLKAIHWGLDMDRHGADQRLLNAELWPQVKDLTMIHQRRQDIQYPDALETRPVAPKVHPLDQLVHMGAAYDVEKAMAILDAMEFPELAKIRECEEAA